MNFTFSAIAELHVVAGAFDADAVPVHLDALDLHAQRQVWDRHGQVLQLIGDLGRQPVAGDQLDMDLVAGFPGHLQYGRAADDEQVEARLDLVAAGRLDGYAGGQVAEIPEAAAGAAERAAERVGQAAERDQRLAVQVADRARGEAAVQLDVGDVGVQVRDRDRAGLDLV